MAGKYDELIAAIRHCFTAGKTCRGCPLDECPGEGVWEWAMIALTKQAADAIEELSRENKSLAKTVNEAAELLHKRNKPRWIPVTEEPPLKVGDDGYNGYLVYANGYYEVADYTIDKFDNAPYFHVNGEYEPTVTHFMPLPEPPKEET